MSGMIETVARAMHLFDAGWAGTPGSMTEALWLRDQEFYIGRARACLMAMKEPTATMAAAGADNLFGSSSDDWSDDARAVWSAMVQAALDEKER